MPALNYNLIARADTAGRNFTIIFTTAAVFVVITCLVFGFIIPKYRKRRRPRPPSTQFATSPLSNLTAGIASREFPSHPALCRNIRKRPSGQLRQYDPRCETPFPNNPAPGESVSLPSITPRSYPATDAPTSGGLFSPARDRQTTEQGDAAREAQLIPMQDQETQADHDYILALPEPCLLHAKSAGKAPPLKRQLDKFPMPRSSSSQTDKLAHPNKLFRDLQLRESMTSVVTPSPLPVDEGPNTSNLDPSSSKQKVVAQQVKERKATIKKDKKAFGLPQEYEMRHWRLRRLERRGTWSSNADMRHAGLDIYRSGTVVKPKTSAADISFPLEGKKTIKQSSSKNGTFNPSEYQESTVSRPLNSGTPPTSPVEISEPRVPSVYVRDGIATPTPYVSQDRATPSSMALPSVDRTAPMCTIPEGKPANAKKASIFKQVRPLARNRPACLDLNNVRRTSSLRRRFQRHSMSSVGSLLVPLVRSKRPSVQASSVYSRDTFGASIAPSPISPAFSENTSAGASHKAGAIHRKASSLDLLKTKIDDWRLDTPEIENLCTSPPAKGKRSLSELGPYSPTFADSGFGSVYNYEKDTHGTAVAIAPKNVPTICIGRASDDIFRDPQPEIDSGRVLKRVLDMEVAASTLSLGQAPKKGTAPGGADWL